MLKRVETPFSVFPRQMGGNVANPWKDATRQFPVCRNDKVSYCKQTAVIAVVEPANFVHTMPPRGSSTGGSGL
jgi:hypothetical protein